MYSQRDTAEFLLRSKPHFSDECHERLSWGHWVALGQACQLTWSFRRRAEPPASDRKGDLFLRGKVRKGRGDGRGGGRKLCRTQWHLYHWPFQCSWVCKRTDYTKQFPYCRNSWKFKCECALRLLKGVFFTALVKLHWCKSRFFFLSVALISWNNLCETWKQATGEVLSDFSSPGFCKFGFRRAVEEKEKQISLLFIFYFFKGPLCFIVQQRPLLELVSWHS